MSEESNNQGQILGKLFLIVGPSGSGKGSIITRLSEGYPGFVYPVSSTTRKPRKGEIDGEVYNFISKEDFEKGIENGDFLEYAVVHSDNYYGTSKRDIMDPLMQGAVVIREVDIQGFHSISALIPKEHLVSIFVKVSSLDDLKDRILKRGALSDDELERRMDSAAKEIAQSGDCDYLVSNDWGKLRNAVKEVETIILKEIKDLY